MSPTDPPCPQQPPDLILKRIKRGRQCPTVSMRRQHHTLSVDTSPECLSKHSSQPIKITPADHEVCHYDRPPPLSFYQSISTLIEHGMAQWLPGAKESRVAGNTVHSSTKTTPAPASGSVATDHVYRHINQMHTFERRTEGYKTQLAILKTHSHVKKESEESLKTTTFTCSTSTLSKMSPLFSDTERRWSLATSHSHPSNPTQDDLSSTTPPPSSFSFDAVTADYAAERRYQRRKRVRHSRQRYQAYLASYGHSSPTPHDTDAPCLLCHCTGESYHNPILSQEIYSSCLSSTCSSFQPMCPLAGPVTQDSVWRHLGDKRDKRDQRDQSEEEEEEEKEEKEEDTKEMSPRPRLFPPVKPTLSQLTHTLPTDPQPLPLSPTDSVLGKWLSEQYHPSVNSVNTPPPTPMPWLQPQGNTPQPQPQNNRRQSRSLPSHDIIKRDTFNTTLHLIDQHSHYDTVLLNDLVAILTPIPTPTPISTTRTRTCTHFLPPRPHTHLHTHPHWLSLFLSLPLLLSSSLCRHLLSRVTSIAYVGWQWCLFLTILGLTLLMSILNGPDLV
ncbi:hypothetical protein BDF14DRAFT_1099150 [Spinellus fusiger]|nr:hypothetical protein BDF14DRAFT_1099150 [Spinellus fusiger]